jgi:hypothetical protein
MKKTGRVVCLFGVVFSVLSVQGVDIVTTELPEGDVGLPYYTVLSAGNGTPPYSWEWSEPGAVNYTETSALNSFAATGTAQGWRAGEGDWLLTFPFNFPCFDKTYSSCRVDSNGKIWFGAHRYDYTEPILSVFENDLNTTWGDIYIDANASRVIIRWEGSYYYNSPPVSFSATLAADGTITCKYGGGNDYGGLIQLSSGDGMTFLTSPFSYSGSMHYAADIIFSPDFGPTVLSGLTLSADGIISGIPTAPYSNQVVVSVMDGLGDTDRAWFDLVLYDDRDNDGMLDAWELQIVDDNPADGLVTISDVLREDDYDGDGFLNIEEYLLGFNPVIADGDPPDTIEEGLELVAKALTNEADSAYFYLIDDCFASVVDADPGNYAARVYRAASRFLSLAGNEEFERLLEEFGFSLGWNFMPTGALDITNAPLPDTVVDVICSNVLPLIDASYADLDVIPTNWSGTAEISTNYFPVDVTVYADIGDVTAAMSALKLLRSQILTLNAYSLNVDYENLQIPVDGPLAAITVDGLTNDWANVPVQLVGEYGSVINHMKAARGASSIYLLIQLQGSEIYPLGLEGAILLDMDSWVEIDVFPPWGYTNIWFSAPRTNTTLISAVYSNRAIEIEVPVPDGIAIANAGIEWMGIERAANTNEWWLSLWDECEAPFSCPADVLLQTHPEFLQSVRSAPGLSMAQTNMYEAVELCRLADGLIKSRTDALMHFIEYDPTNELDRMEFFNGVDQVELSLDGPQKTVVTNELGEIEFDEMVYLGALFQPDYLTRSMFPECWQLIWQPLDGTFPDPTFGGVLHGMTQYKGGEYFRRGGWQMDADGDGLTDGWEFLYSGHPTNCIAQQDDDGDGQSNLDEYLSGMNPTNAASCFQASFAAVPAGGGSQVIVEWPAAEGRVYDIHWSPRLGQDFALLETGLAYPLNSYTDTLHRAASAGFYRVVGRMPGAGDFDADGLPDEWERLFLGSRDAAGAGTDSDGDGQDNISEFIAGTDPANAASCFAVTGAGQDAAGFVVEWYSVTDRTYSVMWAPEPGGDFQVLQTGIEYPQGSCTDSVHSAESQGFYRVDARLK